MKKKKLKLNKKRTMLLATEILLSLGLVYVIIKSLIDAVGYQNLGLVALCVFSSFFGVYIVAIIIADAIKEDKRMHQKKTCN